MVCLLYFTYFTALCPNKPQDTCPDMSTWPRIFTREPPPDIPDSIPPHISFPAKCHLIIKGCLHYDTCTPYMYVVQVYSVHVS